MAAFNKQQAQAVWRFRFPKANRQERNRPRLTLISFLCSNPNCKWKKNQGMGATGWYPAREATRRNMSKFRYCRPACRAAHYRERRRAKRRLEALSVKAWCQWCGVGLRPEYRPGRPRLYCSPTHRRAAAEAARQERRGPEATLEGKEKAVEFAKLWLGLALSRHPDKPGLAKQRRQELRAAAEDLVAYKARLAKRAEAQRRRRARATHEAAEAVLADLGLTP